LNFERRHPVRWLGIALLAGAPAAMAMTLSDAWQRAASHDPTAAASLATYEADREAAVQERGTMKPTVSAVGQTYMADTKSEFAFGGAPRESYDGWDAGIEARQPLFRLDWSARKARARASDELAETGLTDRRQQLLRKVAERYIGVLVAEDGLRQAEAEVSAIAESLADTRKRYQVELIPGTDVKEAEASDDLARARLLAARRDLEAARDQLDETTGNGYAVLPQLPAGVHFPSLEPAVAEQWLEVARTSSPAIATAEQNLRVAKANLASSRSDAAPTLDVVASANRQDSTDYSLGQRQDDGRIGVELRVPLYAGGINTSRVRAASAQVRNADAELRRIRLETERQTRQLFRQVQTAYTEVAAFERALASAEAAATATGHGYDAGTRTITDVLNAKSRTVQARRDLNQTRYNLLLGVVQLKQAAGVLSAGDFREVDRVLTVAGDHGADMQ